MTKPPKRPRGFSQAAKLVIDVGLPARSRIVRLRPKNRVTGVSNKAVMKLVVESP
jgi:hypothetical protein